MSGPDWKSFLNGESSGYNFPYRSEHPPLPEQQPSLPPPPSSTPSNTPKKVPVINQLKPVSELTTKHYSIKNVQKLKGGKRKSRRHTKKYRHSRRK